jgi:hypothetical protein|tara:strand:+ start:365 stop:1333 length:969 start_codon:yes stop_codon:yes gene_type:complete
LLGILHTSRNNFRFLEKFWIPKICSISGNHPILNIDEDSNPEEKAHGIEICKQNNITFMDREKRGMHQNLLTAARFFEPKGVKYIIWFQIDSWPLQDNFFDSFSTLCESGQLDNFGVIGYNGIAQNILEQNLYDQLVKELNNGGKPIGIIGRSPLEKGDMWLCPHKTRRIKYPIPPEKYTKSFAVESVAWFAACISIKMLREHIDSSHKFYFHHSWDDLCFQFLAKNIYNISIADLYVTHRPDLKPHSDLPERSVRFAYKGDDRYHSLVGFGDDAWQQVWGFSYDKRETFKKVKDRYKGTLLSKYYSHDPHKGPLKSWNIEP